MKPETRDTVLMILRADNTVTQPMMDAILVALDGGELSDLVTREEAQRLLHVGLREVQKLAKKGFIHPVMGSGSRALGYSRSSVARHLLSRTIKRKQEQCTSHLQ